MIESRETLEYSRSYLRAHKNFPVPPLDAQLDSIHAKVSALPDGTNGFAFFGLKKDPRSHEVDAKGKLTWDTKDRVLNAWFWRPDGQFSGIFLTNADDYYAAQDLKFPTEKYNGLHIESRERSTNFAIGNISVGESGEVEMQEVALDIPEAASDRLLSYHFDKIVTIKISEFLNS